MAQGTVKVYMKYALLVLVMLGSLSWGQAQSKKKKKKSATKQEQAESAPSSRDPGNSNNLFRGERKVGKSKKGRKYGGLEAKAVEEYQQRMKANAKKYRKIERIKDRPQYSDPSYFGHKRKPKKRPVGKRKLCKECGIVH